MSVLRLKRGARTLVRLATIAVLVASTGYASGQTAADLPQSPEAEHFTKYRRVFVPSDRPEEWPTQGRRYLPVDRLQFQRLVEAAADRRRLAEAGGAHLLKSQYSAKLDENLNLAGQATFDVKSIDASPHILKLSPLNIAVNGAKWSSDEQEKPALIGMWAGRGRVEAYGVLVERSGRLIADWMVPPSTGVTSNINYRLQLPAAVERQFAIELPAEYIASMTSSRLVENAPLDGARRKRWTFQLSAADEHRLQLNRDAAQPARLSSLPLVAIAEAYGVSREGLNYEAELRIQPRSAGPSELRLKTSDSLRVTETLLDRAAIDVSQDPTDPDAITVPLPKSTSPMTVTIRGVAPAVLDSSWTLPRITAPDAMWTEGTTTLWIDAQLELQSIVPRSARLLNAVGVGQADGGEAYRLQAWSNDASTEVILAERQSQLYSESGVVAEFADRELAGRSQVRIWASGGPVLHVAAKLEPDWNLESVEATPADALAQWHVSGEGRDRRLHLQLRRSPTESSPLRIALSAHKPLRGWAPSATLGELNWIRFPSEDGASSRLLVSDRRDGRLVAERRAADEVLPPESLSAAQRELIGEPRSGLLFDAGQTAHDAIVRVVSTPARFQGEGWIELTRTETGFEHRVDIVCRPTTGAVSELTVAASRALPSDVHWTLIGDDMQPVVELVAPLRSSNANQGTAPESPRQYRVRFPQPLSSEFRLRATWRGAADAADAVNSLVLLGADTWQSWAILRGDPATAKVNSQGCLPAAATPADQRPDAPGILACYRLGDDPASTIAATPILSVAGQPGGRTAGKLICWLCDVNTLQFADGHQTHRIAYRLEINEAAVAQLGLPKGYELVSTRIDESIATVQRSARGAEWIGIPLSKSQKIATLTIDLHGRRRKLDAAELISPSLLQTSFPVVRGRWTVSAPAPFTVGSEARRHAQAGWRQRLFGPLAYQPHAAVSGHFGMSAAMGAASSSGPPSIGTGRDATSIPQGWSSETQEFVTAPQPVEIRRFDDARATWHVAWLISAVAAALLWPIGQRIIALLAAILAICCLVFPLGWIVVPQAALLGLLAGSIVRELLLRTQRFAAVKYRMPSHVTALLVVLFAGALTEPTYAADNKNPPPSVLFPIDDDGQPIGPDVYAPEPLLNELLPSSQRTRYDGAAYVLVSALYELELTEAPARGELQCSGGSLHFRVRTFQRNATVHLPLNQQEADWLEGEHTLDGAPISLDWNEDGKGCSLAVTIPGEHRLHLKLVPCSASGPSRNELSLHVPPIPAARLEVVHPPGIEELSAGATRPSAKAAQPTRSTTQLTASDIVELSWPKRLRSTASGVTVDQLSWLEVDPAVARLQVRLRLTGDPSSLEKLELAVSPQLKLLPLPEDSPLRQLQTFPGAPAIMELAFRSPPQLPITIPLSFQLQRSVSLGRISFPSVRVLGLETSSHHFAASIDLRLRVREDSPAGLAPATIAELERVWGALPTTPALQYTVAGSAPVWSLQVEPLPLRFTPRENVEVLCAADEASIEYSAAVTDTDDDILVYQLAVPATLAVEDVGITLDTGEAAALRWTRPRPDVVSVFLGVPLNTPHRLNLTGKLPYASDRRLPLPAISFDNISTSPINVTIRRTSDVLVKWSDDVGAPPAPNTTAAMDSRDLVVGHYSVARNGASLPELEILANNASFSADALLTLDLTPAEPVGSLLVQGRVTRGLVDRVQFVVGEDWRGPFIATPHAAVLVRPDPRDVDRRTIEVRLPKTLAAGEDLALRISGRVALENDQRVRFPTVRMLGAREHRLFLVLPDTPLDQTAEWMRRGLELQPLPAALAKAAGQLPGAIAYRVQRDSFVAEQRVFPNALRQPAVLLAESRIALDESGDGSALTQLVVQPGVAAQVTVKLPAGSRLIYAAVDDRAIVHPVVEGGRWLPPAGSRYLPRMFTIGYRLPRVEPGQLELQVPRVYVEGKPLPIGRSLWRIDGEPASTLRVEGGGLSLTQSAFRATARREKIGAVVDASPLAFQLPEWELRQWFQPWLDQLAEQEVEATAAGLADAEAAWSRLRERIAALKPAPSQDTSRATRATEALAESPTSAWFQSAPAGNLTLAPRTAGRGAGRWMLAIVIAGVSVVAWRYPEKLQPASDALSRFPAIPSVLAGVLWWAFLSPSLLGPAIIAFSLAAIFKSRQMRQQSEVAAT
jgi:hypothetical protein